MLWEVHIYIYIYMITTIIYVDIAFFYRKANILHRWSNILRVSLLQISVIQMETCIASHGLSAVAILKLCCVSVQDSRGWSVYEHTAVRVFLLTDNLHLLDCSVTWSPLTRTDADWTCWLAANARVWKHKHRFSVLMLQHTDCNGRHPQVLHCRRQQAWHWSQHARRRAGKWQMSTKLWSFRLWFHHSISGAVLSADTWNAPYSILHRNTRASQGGGGIWTVHHTLWQRQRRLGICDGCFTGTIT